MRYRNVRTGEIRDFSCTLNGKIWEPVKKAPVPIKEEISEDEKPVKKIKKVR